MTPRTRTEYTLCELTKCGSWRPLSLKRYGSKVEAERAREAYIALAEAHPKSFYERYIDSRIMKRQVTITMTKWEDAEV